MPGIVRKLVIVAAVDGLLLHPSAQRAQRPAPSLQINYATNEIKALEDRQQQSHGNSSASLEAHGIVGRYCYT